MSHSSNTGSAAPSANKQTLLNSFYALENLITVSITIPDADWTALKAAEPRGGRCNFSYVGDRFDWFKATSVTISRTKFPAQKGTFSAVGIIKKSYCGSFSTTKPSLRIDFARFSPDNEKPVEALIGIKAITLNNCKQDDSFIRQPLGYELFKQAGVPYARCNFAKVVVNDVDLGLYLNLEPIKKGFIQNNFAGNDKGNCYELEVGEDVDPGTMAANRISYEGFSDFKGQKDLKLAAEKIASEGLVAAQKLVDFDALMRFFAMETLLKHWDGYTQNKNNTYIYNDKVAVANPGVNDIKLKFIPCGIDQIMQEGRDFHIGGNSVLSNLVRKDSAATAKLFAQIKTFADTIFSRQNYDAVLKPMIDRMEALLATAGAKPAGEISGVKKQLKLIRSGAYQLIGELPQDPTLWLAKDEGDCMHASGSQVVPGGPPSTAPSWDVYHMPRGGATSDNWIMAPADTPGYTTFKNEAYGTWLYGDVNVKTAGGNPNVFSVHQPKTLPGSMFAVVPNPAQQKWHASGYFVLWCKANNQFVYFSDKDVTAKGGKQVHLVDSDKDEGTAVFLF